MMSREGESLGTNGGTDDGATWDVAEREVQITEFAAERCETEVETLETERAG